MASTQQHTVDAWTVGRLRAALEGLPDDLPIEIDIPDAPGSDQSEAEFVIVGAGLGWIDSGDGHGLHTDDSLLCITADYPTGEYEID